MSSRSDNRPAPEAFLAEATAEERAREGRGRLKIFLGASPGVGKTFAMLEEARMRRRQGVDVVVALVETHGRAETAAILSDLEVLPRQSITYRGQVLTEMDIDGVLARKPQLALIDEFAHTNAPTSRHPKRWQDVIEVLDAGISVTTTLNIQHIESLNDVVARITGVRVQETVPDAVLQQADEIELIDLPPDELIQRLKDGKVYVPEQVGRALGNFFSKGNLTALRELALRTAASRVDEDMLSWMGSNAVAGPWPTQERLLVCVNDAPIAKTLVRAGKRMAERARIPWIVAHVADARRDSDDAETREQVAEALILAESLGAEAITVQATHSAAEELLGLARKRNVTRLVVGRAQRRDRFAPRVFGLLSPSLTDDILDAATDFEVTVVTHHAKAARKQALAAAARPVVWQPLLDATRDSAIAATVATLAAWPFWTYVPVASLAAIYLIGVLWVGVRNGLAGALAAAIFGFLAYNFFFTAPYFSFAVEQSESVVALVVFLISAIFTGSLAGRQRAQVEQMRLAQRRTAMLYDFARKIASVNSADDVLWAAVAHIAFALDCRSLILMPDSRGKLRQVQGHPTIEDEMDPRDESAALWAFQKNEPAGAGTATLPTSPWLFVPLATNKAPIGVIGVAFREPDRTLDPETRRLLIAVEDQVAIALERHGLASELENARVSQAAEKLRAALLNSVSHDLRTPLVSVIGALTSLAETPEPPQTIRHKLAGIALEEAQRLNRFVQNLLDMTRLAHGALKPRLDTIDLADVIAGVRSDLARPLAEHAVCIRVAVGSLPVSADPILLRQVLVNVLENAAKYTPPGTSITIDISGDDVTTRIAVSDEGPGIPIEDRPKVFDHFYRIARADSQVAGTGLGLAIAKGMVEAMDGTIRIAEPDGGRGTKIEIALPAARRDQGDEGGT